MHIIKRGDIMKKTLAVMAFGMGVGAAGSYLMYNQYKNGNLGKLLNKVEKKASDMIDNM